MTTTTYKIQDNLVKDLRKIRDQINTEIKDMTFEEERVYLDKLLSEERKSSHNKSAAASEADSVHQQL